MPGAARSAASPESLRRADSAVAGASQEGPIPQLLAPSPKLETPSPIPGATRGGGCGEKQHQRASDMALSAARSADESGPRLKPRDVDPATVCGIAPQLLAADPTCEDTLVTYGMLVSLRAQGYQRAAVWYQAAARVLHIARPNRAVLAACDKSDHLAIAIENEAAGVRASSSTSARGDGAPSPGRTPYPPPAAAGSTAAESDGSRSASRGEPPVDGAAMESSDRPGADEVHSADAADATDAAGSAVPSGSNATADGGSTRASGAGGITVASGRSMLSAASQTPGATLDVSGSYVGTRGLLAIISTIPLMTRLRRVIFRAAGLDSTTLALLCHACRGLRLLEEFDVSDNPAASSVGAEAVAGLCGRLSTLVEVRVDGVEMIRPTHRKIEARIAANRQRIDELRSRRDSSRASASGAASVHEL